MSDSRKHKKDPGLGNVTDRLRASLDLGENKPDCKEVDFGSPISPLRTRTTRAGPTTSGLTTTSSSSSSSGSLSSRTTTTSQARKRTDGTRKNHSGELSGSNEGSPTAVQSHRSGGATLRSHSDELSGSNEGSPTSTRKVRFGGTTVHPNQSKPTKSIGSSRQPSAHEKSVNSPPQANVPPTGSPKGKTLATGTGIYGYGSIMRPQGVSPNMSSVVGNIKKSEGSSGGESVTSTAATKKKEDPEVFKNAGNVEYQKGNFEEALKLYNKAIAISPNNAAYRSNSAAALTGLGRVLEAVKECEEAVRLDRRYGRAHSRLGSLLIRLGMVEIARKHVCFSGPQPDPESLQKLITVEKHLIKCSYARKVSDWKSVLKEVEAAITAGADHSALFCMCRAEALLKLGRPDDLVICLSNIPKFDQSSQCSSCASIFGMVAHAYIFYVHAQTEMALGRFESAVTNAEKASQLDIRSLEISELAKNVRFLAKARARGNSLFNSNTAQLTPVGTVARLTEASEAYGQGLKIDPSNPVLYCNRAACWFKLGKWERSIEDCNQALSIYPKYTKAIIRRAASNTKLEKWADAVSDYEVLRKELPNDKEIIASLFHAQVELKKSRGEDVSNMKLVEEVSSLEQFRAALSSPGVTVVQFRTTFSPQCEKISPFVDQLYSRYLSVNFLTVDIKKSPEIASSENVRIVPTFKFYKNGKLEKEMTTPTYQVLEASVRLYTL